MWGTNEELDLSTHVCHEAVSATLVLEGVKKNLLFYNDDGFEYGFLIYFLGNGEVFNLGRKLVGWVW